MKRLKTLTLAIVGVCMLVSCTQPKNSPDYLKTVLNNLEEIKSAEYRAISEAWNPGDTAVVYRVPFKVIEYDNPSDTTIGAGFINMKLEDSLTLSSAYDGRARVSVYEEDKGIMIGLLSVIVAFPISTLRSDRSRIRREGGLLGVGK